MPKVRGITRKVFMGKTKDKMGKDVILEPMVQSDTSVNGKRYSVRV